MSVLQANTLMDAQVLTKRIYNLLSEVMDLSNQLAEALDRNDRVVVQMLVDMRSQPVKKLQDTRQALREQRDALDGAAKERLNALLNGEPASDPAEKQLEAQVASNQRLLKRILELDKQLNRRLTGGKSIYKK